MAQTGNETRHGGRALAAVLVAFTFLLLEGTGTASQPRGVFNTPGIGSSDAGNPNGGNVTIDPRVARRLPVHA